MAEPARLDLQDASATVAAGRRLAAAASRVRPDSLVIYLEGELGAGKTTFARGFLAGLGHADRVPSPTYTLIEPYDVPGYRVFHIDLYRIRDTRELADLALAELTGPGTIALVEWPEQGAGHLPAADLRICLSLSGHGRVLEMIPVSAAGMQISARLISGGNE
jgi:tRNA threonylcarbamoyladenosine biosynthesis protein TsaE